MLEPCVCAPLPYESFAFLAFMRLPLLTGLFDSTARFGACLTLVVWMSSWVFILCILFLLWAEHCLGVGFLFFNSAYVSFHPLSMGWLVPLPCHCIVSVIISFILIYFTTFGLVG